MTLEEFVQKWRPETCVCFGVKVEADCKPCASLEADAKALVSAERERCAQVVAEVADFWETLRKKPWYLERLRSLSDGLRQDPDGPRWTAFLRKMVKD